MRNLILSAILFSLGWLGPQVRAQSGTVPPTTPEPPAAATAQPGATPGPQFNAGPNAAPNDPAPTATAAPDATKPKEAAKPKKPAATPGPAAPLRGALALAPEKALPVRITRFDTAPTIDGKLDEPFWQQAAMLNNFFQISPGDNVAPSQPTEVLLGYDAKFLYIAFRAHDEPGKVRATVGKRDDILNADDTVRILLDTFNDQRKAYVLVFNPFGIQQDGIRTEGSGVDFSVDIVMESKGTVTNDGYVVEVAIPFKSLRYEAGRDRLWGVQVIRQIQRLNNETDSWMPISRDVNGLLNQAGHITGLEGISTERTLELIPSLTVSETGKLLAAYSPVPNDAGRIVNQPVHFEPGLTAKFGLTPTITLNAALNPDFAQVEADQTVVTTNQRFPIFFQEKRPFFLEGLDIFQLPLNIIHTRTIVDPDYAVKLAGKQGRNTFGLMLASDAAPGNYTGDERLARANQPFLDHNATVGVLRLKRDVGREHSLGLALTNYNFVWQHNTVASVDGRFKLDPVTTFTFHLVGTTANRFFRDPELDTATACANLGGDQLRYCRRQLVYRTGNGLGYYAQYTRAARHVFMNLLGFGRTRDFRSDVGFVRRTNTNSNQFYIEYNSDQHATAQLVSWNISSQNQIQYDWQGHIQGWNSGVRAFLNFQRQTFVGFGFDNYFDKLYEQEFGPKRTPAHGGAFFGGPERSSNNKSLFFGGGTTPSKKYSAQMFVNVNFGGLDFDFGGGPKFPRVSAAALADPNAGLDPGPGRGLDINGSFAYQPTDALRFTLDYTKARLRRYDTGRVAFDDNIYALRATYQFTRFTFARARIDYDTLQANIRGQFLMGWTPNPGTSFYVGYNDDLNRNGFNPINGQLEPGFRRNGRTFFIKLSYLFQRSFSR